MFPYLPFPPLSQKIALGKKSIPGRLLRHAYNAVWRPGSRCDCTPVRGPELSSFTTGDNNILPVLRWVARERCRCFGWCMAGAGTSRFEELDFWTLLAVLWPPQASGGLWRLRSPPGNSGDLRESACSEPSSLNYHCACAMRTDACTREYHDCHREQPLQRRLDGGGEVPIPLSRGEPSTMSPTDADTSERLLWSR